MKQSTVATAVTNRYPELVLKTCDTYYWSPGDKTVFYKEGDTSDEGTWALLHEAGHALLGHKKYHSDFELLQMEMFAWEKAKEIAAKLQGDLGSKSLDLRETADKSRLFPETRAKNKQRTTSKLPLVSNPRSVLVIDEDHIQDCLDSYRNWLHKRSLCPDCHLSSVQSTPSTYTCIFCHKKWNVTSERFCRPYRRTT